MPNQPLESDWKTFRGRLGFWRERYLEAQNQEIIKVLADEARTPTERFWDALDLMKSEARILRDCLDGASRSRMVLMMFALYGQEFIGPDDLEEFSPALRDHILESQEERKAERDGPRTID